jgi:hypothetical protein
MDLLAALDVDVRNDFWSIAAAVATIVAAAGTVAAVVTALFLPRWQAAKTRPKLTLRAEYVEWERFYDGNDGRATVFDGPQLLLANEAGRETARGVELLASVYELSSSVSRLTEDGRPGPVKVFVDVPLNHDAADGSYGRPSTNVGPGAERRANMTRMGEPAHIYDTTAAPPLGSDSPVFELAWCGTWATWPERRDQLHWIESDQDYVLELLVTGDNFDAFRMRGVVRLERQDWSNQPNLQTNLNQPVFLRMLWVEDLKPVTDRLRAVA